MINSAKAILIDTSGKGQSRDPVLVPEKPHKAAMESPLRSSDLNTQADSQSESRESSVKIDPNKCQKGTKPCGHACHGVVGEQTCLPCLDADCQQDSRLQQSGDELCSICYTSELHEEACVQLMCGHVFHESCVL